LSRHGWTKWTTSRWTSGQRMPACTTERAGL
jgi:hypothetical protein